MHQREFSICTVDLPSAPPLKGHRCDIIVNLIDLGCSLQMYRDGFRLKYVHAMGTKILPHSGMFKEREVMNTLIGGLFIATKSYDTHLMQEVLFDDRDYRGQAFGGYVDFSPLQHKISLPAEQLPMDPIIPRSTEQERELIASILRLLFAREKINIAEIMVEKDK